MSTAPARRRQSFVRANLRIILGGLVLAGIAGSMVVKRLQPLPAAVTEVVRGKAVDAVYATGTVEADDRVNVKAKTSGSIAEVLVKEGQAVKKGDLLARIDNPVVTFDLKRGQADLSAATAQAGPSAPQLAALRAQGDAIKADLQTARADLGRIDTLVKSGSVAEADLDRARARVTQLEGQLAANEAQQRALRIDLEANAQRQQAAVQSLASRVSDTEVRAPLDGVVLAKSVEIGEVVAINQTLFKIGDTRNLILEVSVDEADVARVHDGTGGVSPSPAAVSLYAFPKEVFRGKVFDVLPDANRDRKAFLAKVRLDKPPPGLRSGMSAEVNIIAREESGVLLAPSESETDGVVWVVKGGRARKQSVNVGIRDLLRVQILSGLDEGDAVVVEGQDKLSEGARVAATVKPADKLKPLPDQNQPAQTPNR
ncbi:efflux transporter, RND family, MFP subunit protein [Minicystis rosea]|nr:efflux transporter, RND family, MFP subunit protein [Minicystis rosea]